MRDLHVILRGQIIAQYMAVAVRGIVLKTSEGNSLLVHINRKKYIDKTLFTREVAARNSSKSEA